VAWWTGLLAFPVLVTVALLAGVATVFFDVGYQSILPSVVGRGGLVEGNTRLETAYTGAAAAGPALGGGLVQLVGAAAAVLADAVSYLVSAALLTRMRSVEPTPAPTGRSLRADLVEGVRFVVAHPVLRPLGLCTATSNLFAGAFEAVSVLYLSRGLGLPAGAVGLVVGAGAVGGVLGALLAGGLVTRLGLGPAVTGSLLVTAPFALLTCTANPWLYAAGVVVVVFGVSAYNIASLTFRQTVCPDHLLGRMNASLRFASWGVVPLGALLGGALGELIGLRATLLVIALGGIVAPGWLLAAPLRRVRDPAPGSAD
jgi:hypothetical protein